MGHIFISYSHKDTEYAHKLADNLQSKGLSVWIDARLDYGSQWPTEIEKQLDSCSAFILIMSPRASASEWVQSELQRAKRKLKPIFPLLLEGEEPWLSVESTQYYDVRDGQMPDARFFGAISRLVPIDQAAETYVRLPKSSLKKEVVAVKEQAKPPEQKLKTGILVAIIGAVVIFCVACLTIIVPSVLSYVNIGEKGNSIPTPATPNYADASPTFTPPIPTITPESPSSVPSTPTSTDIPPTSTDIPPTFAPLIPTAIPMPPSPAGRWIITANNYEGELNIITIKNGNISGTIYDNPIEGSWNEFGQEISFKRINSSDPNVYQIYYGEQIKQGNRYVLAGNFEDHDVNGDVTSYDWFAER